MVLPSTGINDPEATTQYALRTLIDLAAELNLMVKRLPPTEAIVLAAARDKALLAVEDYWDAHFDSED